MGKERQDEGTVPVPAGRAAQLARLGRGLLSRPQLALMAGAALALLLGATGGLWLALATSEAPPGVTAGSPAGRTVAAASAASSALAHDAASAPMQPGTRPTVLTKLDDAAKRAAREAVAAARAARAAHASGSDVSGSSASRSSRAPAVVPVAVGAPVWAVSTRVLRTRFESEQLLVALRAAASRSAPAKTALRFEVMPVGSDWRAVSWPFTERADAERLREELQSRGVRVEVIAF